MLFNEPKLLKSELRDVAIELVIRFSALQRAEIAEIHSQRGAGAGGDGRFSALQRAEIAEILILLQHRQRQLRFQCSSTSRNC